MPKSFRICLLAACSVALFGCPATNSNNGPEPTDAALADVTEEDGANASIDSDSETEVGGQTEDPRVSEVSVSGDDDAYTFSVTLRTPDSGCEQYADWWEVVAEDETLVYRRILAHSHVDEQPFTRSGGPVGVSADDQVTVRLHMNTTGYATAALRGSVADGFDVVELPADFASGLDEMEPLPSGCAF